MNCGDPNPRGQHHERDGVDECGEHACALKAKGFGVCRRTQMKVHRDERQDDGQHVRGVVARLRDQRQRVRTQAKEEGSNDIQKRGRK